MPTVTDVGGAVPVLGEPDSLDAVRAERDAASARCRELEHQLGAMRGRVKALERAMWRRTARRALLAAYAKALGSLVDRRGR